MKTPHLEFWFEFASTYSYIAASRIEELCAEAGVSLSWKPFSLAPIFALQGWNTSPFAINALRGNYMWRDMERLTAKHGLRWNKPSVFPRNCTLAARVAAAHEDAPWLGAYVRAVFEANFGDDADLNDEPTVRGILRAIGRDDVPILRAALDEPLRNRMRENTERAMELGIFGAPNCIVDGELFWGEETLEDAIAWAINPRASASPV